MPPVPRGKLYSERATKLTRQLTTFGRGTISAPAVLDLRAHITEFRDLIEGALRGDIELSPMILRITPIRAGGGSSRIFSAVTHAESVHSSE